MSLDPLAAVEAAIGDHPETADDYRVGVALTMLRRSRLAAATLRLTNVEFALHFFEWHGAPGSTILALRAELEAAREEETAATLALVADCA